MNRYSYRKLLCSVLLFWGLASTVSAEYYSVKFLRELNPSLWDELKLNRRFSDPNQQLEIMDEHEWAGLLAEIVRDLKARMTPSTPFGALGVLYNVLLKKPKFDPAGFPVLWLAFRELREAFPFDFRDEDFLQQLRNFSVITFPAKLHWSSQDLSELSLSGATLSGHVFMWTVLNNVNFSGAVLIRCHFLNCVIHKAIVSLAADISTSVFTGCRDDESTEMAMQLYKMQSNDCQGDDPENLKTKSRLLLQQIHCLMTSNQEDHGDALLESIPSAPGAMVQYFKLLMKYKKYELLNQVIVSPDTLTHVNPHQYQNDPETVLRLAWTLYVLIHRAGVSEQHQETVDQLWNLLVIGLVGLEVPDPEYAQLSPGRNLFTAPQTNLGFQADLLEFLNSHKFKAVVIRKDDSCFYSALAYHIPQASLPGARSVISQGDWLRQVLGLMFLQHLIQQGFTAEQLSHLVPPEVFAAVEAFAAELPAEKVSAIQSNPLLDAPATVLHDLITPHVWAPVEFGSLAAILLEQPVFQIQMQHQEFVLQQNHPDGTTDTLDEISATPGNPPPLLVIYSGNSHWLTAIIPLMLVLSDSPEK